MDSLRQIMDRLARTVDTALFDLESGGVYLAQGRAGHEGGTERGEWRNWTDSYRIRPRQMIVPEDEQALCQHIADSSALRVVGGGHSFNDSPLCPETMISLDALNRVLAVDPQARTIRVQAGIRLRDLNRTLHELGLGLPVLGSTDAQSIAGLIATDLHGSGRDHGFLSEQIRALRVIDAAGHARSVRPGDPLFHAAVGGLGAVGVVSEVELELVPAFNLRKRTAMVDGRLSEEEVEERVASHDHVSFYVVGGTDRVEAIRMHTWDRTLEPPTPGWEREKMRSELRDFALSAFLPGAAELLSRMDEDASLSNLAAPDEDLVLPGSSGFGRTLFYRHDEIEHGLPRDRFRGCLARVMDLLAARDRFSIIELRFTPDRSTGLIGPGVGRASAWIELATPMSVETGDLYPAVEELLREGGGQPHLGKKTGFSAQDMSRAHGRRFAQFQEIRREQDPTGKLLNAFTRRVFADPAPGVRY